MTFWRRMVVVLAVTCGLVALASPADHAELPAATPSVAEATTPPVQPVESGVMLSPKASLSTTSAVPPSQPTRLEIDGIFPIRARVLPYSGDVLEPPNGDYVDVFSWTRRGLGLPGDGATDTTYIFGHTYAGPTPGVFDHLQELSLGVRLVLTTETGTLRYRLVRLFPVDETDADFRRDPRVWTVAPLEQRGDYVVVIACWLSADGSSQTGKKTIAVFERE